MHHRPLRALIALLLTTGLLAACGNDDDDSAAPGTDDNETTTPADDNGDNGAGGGETWPPDEGRGEGAAGTVTIDGATYGIDAVRECDLTDFFDGDDRERTYMVEGIGLEDPDDEWSGDVVVTAYTGTMSNPDKDMQGIEWSGPEGRYEGLASGTGDSWTVVMDGLDGPPLDLDGDRITGELNLRSHLGSPPVDATVDLATPTTGPVDCD